jgi:hypothetical protein
MAIIGAGGLVLAGAAIAIAQQATQSTSKPTGVTASKPAVNDNKPGVSDSKKAAYAPTEWQKAVVYETRIDKLPFAAKDPTRKLILAKLKGSGPPLPDGGAVRVCTSLKGTSGGTVVREANYKGGCFVDISYATPQAFIAFDKETALNPRSEFSQWGYGAGRTPLLKDKGKLIVTWYAHNRSYKTLPTPEKEMKK